MGLRRTTAITIGLLVLSACTALPGGAKIEGYSATESKPVFGGLLLGLGKDEPALKVRYIFHIHGMGLTVRDEFHDGLFQRLKDAGYELEQGSSDAWAPALLPQTVTVQGEGLDCDSPWTDSVPPPKHPSQPPEETSVAKPCRYDSFGTYRVDRLVRADTHDEIRLYTYFWHRDLWRVQEPYLRVDMNAASRKSRGAITNVVKYNIMDGGLSDASAYTGPMGDLVRAGIGSTLCIMARDAAGGSGGYRQEARNGLSTCFDGVDADSDKAQRLLSTEFSFVTHSLGSRMLFDTLVPDDPTNAARIDTEIKSFTARGVLIDRTGSVYMAANQLPLLATGRVKPVDTSVLPPDTTKSPRPQSVPPPVDGCETGEPFFTALCQVGQRPGATGLAASASNFSDVEIVSFQDPDDLLGFKASGGYRRVNDHLTFIDIVHRNTPQILWLFADPTKAHDNELSRKSSLDLILCGGVASPTGALKARPCLGGDR